MEKEGVIVFGGSAGSIEVIINLFPLVPADFPIPIVVVLHRKNTSEHHLEDVLSRKSKVPVLEIQDKTKIIPGNIYIAPGDYHVLVDNDKTLALDTSEKVNFSRPSIDVAFEEFARVYGSKCIGILLSGANSDGSSGLKRIKDSGGLTIVQSPDSAKVATMPMSAVKLFQPDVIANPQQMAGLLIEASKFPIGDFIRKIK
ncbi:MAG: chemotaxis protein CheB, partial [Bacteroidota bacterium]